MMGIESDGWKLNIGICGESPGIGTSTTAHALVNVLYKAGFPVMYGQFSLRALALELNIPTDGDAFLSFLKSSFVNNSVLDRIWDSNISNQIQSANKNGQFVIFESKVAPILSLERRLSLVDHYNALGIYQRECEIIQAYNFSKYATNLENLFVVYLAGSIDETIKRMLKAGRNDEAISVRERVNSDAKRYLEVYGLNPYDISIVRDAGLANVVLDTLKWNVYTSVNKSLMAIFGDKLEEICCLKRHLEELAILCDNGDYKNVKNSLVEANKAAKLFFQLDVKPVIDEMESLGYTYP